MIRRFVNRNLLDKWDWGVGIADFYSAIQDGTAEGIAKARS